MPDVKYTEAINKKFGSKSTYGEAIMNDNREYEMTLTITLQSAKRVFHGKGWTKKDVKQNVAEIAYKALMIENDNPSDLAPSKNLYKILFHSEEPIGKGQYGSVVKATHKLDGKLYAIKKIPIKDDKEDKYRREVIKLSDCAHSNIVKYYFSWIEQKENKSNLCIQMEFCSDNLENWIYGSRKGRNSNYTMTKILHDLLSSVSHIHSLGIMHRDIKPENIFTNEKDDQVEVKLGDFGFARDQGQLQTVGVGTPVYRAPEVLIGSYDKSADIYSLGMTTLEIFGFFSNSDHFIKHAETLRDNRRLPDKLVENYPVISKFIEQMTVPKFEEDRPTAQEILVSEKFPLGSTRELDLKDKQIKILEEENKQLKKKLDEITRELDKKNDKKYDVSKTCLSDKENIIGRKYSDEKMSTEENLGERKHLGGKMSNEGNMYKRKFPWEKDVPPKRILTEEKISLEKMSTGENIQMEEKENSPKG